MEPSAEVTDLIDEIAGSKRRGMTRGMTMMREREAEFANPLEAALTGIALDPSSREYAEELIDDRWREDRNGVLLSASKGTYPEIIIGSGYHAAVYAATRVLAGYPRPLVIEASGRAGGVFAMSSRPSFYLNSRSSDGGSGISGDRGVNLNYLPGAPIQTTNLAFGEYPTNADMALVIRLALLQYARVLPGFRVSEVEQDGIGANRVSVYPDSGGEIVRGKRVIDARGVGTARATLDRNGGNVADGKTVLSFDQFMRRMAGTWPLRGVRRMAVIGGGDSARCVVESVLGIGPSPYMTPAALDTVQRVDMYGESLPETCDQWRNSERGRYQAIGPFLRADGFGARRLVVYRRRAQALALPGRALVGSRSYDLVVNATGFVEDRITGLSLGDMLRYEVSGQVVAQRNGRIFRVGPHARLPFTDQERDDRISSIASNAVSMFRLGNKTAALAASLTAA